MFKPTLPVTLRHGPLQPDSALAHSATIHSRSSSSASISCGGGGAGPRRSTEDITFYSGTGFKRILMAAPPNTNIPGPIWREDGQIDLRREHLREAQVAVLVPERDVFGGDEAPIRRARGHVPRRRQLAALRQPHVLRSEGLGRRRHLNVVAGSRLRYTLYLERRIKFSAHRIRHAY